MMRNWAGITAANLNLVSGGSVDINGISAGNSNGVTVLLSLDVGGAVSITGPAVFNALMIQADKGINVGADLTTDTGDLIMDGDDNDFDDPGVDDRINFAAGVTIESREQMVLDATTGQMVGAGALTIQAYNGININDSITTNGDLTINADLDDDGVR